VPVGIDCMGTMRVVSKTCWTSAAWPSIMSAFI